KSSSLLSTRTPAVTNQEKIHLLSRVIGVKAVKETPLTIAMLMHPTSGPMRAAVSSGTPSLSAPNSILFRLVEYTHWSGYRTGIFVLSSLRGTPCQRIWQLARPLTLTCGGLLTRASSWALTVHPATSHSTTLSSTPLSVEIGQ
ncbi:unnamed protein product, partial [Symbiodinium microadriaticum]